MTFTHHSTEYDIRQSRTCDTCGEIKLTAPIQGREVCKPCEDKGPMSLERVDKAACYALFGVVCEHNLDWERTYYNDAFSFIGAVQNAIDEDEKDAAIRQIEERL
jgi:hypothetical protein